MTFGSRLKSYRLERKLSQEKVAQALGVSRQAVAKWENDQSLPSSENLLALSTLYEVSLDQLAQTHISGGVDKTILHANLTRWAIIFQAAALNIFIQIIPEEYPFPAGVLAFKLILLFLCSLWMVYNQTYEKNLQQRRKNARIELLYCLVQLIFALTASRTGFRFAGTLGLMMVCFIYIFTINPRYMNRVLVKRKGKK